MPMIFTLNKTKGKTAKSVWGNCPNCNKQVWEELATLDDAYNVWMGRCPYCEALSFLSVSHGLRGYDSQQMHLVLPTEEEIAANDLPKDTPTTGTCGKPASMHGSPLGELYHQLTSQPAPDKEE